MVSALGNILRFLCIFLVMNMVFPEQIPSSGTCPTVTGDPDLNVYEVMGYWYKTKTYNWLEYPCFRDLFAIDGFGNITGDFSFRNGTNWDHFLTYIDLKETAQFYVYTDEAKTQLFGIYVLIYGDPGGCAVLFSCKQVDPQSYIAIITVLCRSARPLNDDVQPALDTIKSQGLDGYPLKDLDQTNCFWL